MKHTPLRYLARIQNSNVDKVIEDGETPVRLCNYVHVFRNDKITADMAFDQGSATKMERKVFALNPGDVIITKDSEDPREIGVPALVVSSAEDIVCGYHLTILRPNEGVHGPYLYYGLCSKIAQEQFMLSARGITRFGLNQDGIGGCAIPLPSMEEQLAIARMLDDGTRHIDDLINEKSDFISLLREKRVAEISHAVTKGINPDAPMKPSGADWLGDVPAHWDAVRLGVIFKEADRRGDPSHPVLSVSIHDGVSDGEVADEDRLRKVALSEDRSVYQGVMPGDLVYNMMRAWQGGFGAVATEGLVSPAYVVARPLSDARTKFIELQLRTPQAVEEMRRYSKGIADFRMRLYWEHFRNVRVALPSPEEQDAILANIERETTRIDGLIHETEHSIALLKEKRAALITAAVTGKIDVRNAA